MKLSAIRSIVDGKRIALIDDSIVRGTTSKRIVTMLREAGAKEVHVRIVSPTMTHPCCYGVDTTTLDELISAKHSVEETCKIIGADSLAFMSVEECLASSNGKCKKMCFACFDGKYPTPMTHDISEINKKK